MDNSRQSGLQHVPQTKHEVGQVDHVCPNCLSEYLDDCLPNGIREMLEARAKVIVACGYSVVFGPIVLCLLSFISSFCGKTWMPDDKLMLSYLGAFGLIAAWKTQPKEQ